MALFKPLLGKRENLPTTLTSGYAYFCTDDGSFWIDYKDIDSVVKRKQINAQEAEKLFGYDIVTIVANDNAAIPTSSAVLSAIEAASSRVTTITLDANNWSGEVNPWSQVVTVKGATDNTKIDLQPTAIQIINLQDSEIALTTENNGGIVTVYALGNKPTVDYTMQVTLTEVVPV